MKLWITALMVLRRAVDMIGNKTWFQKETNWKNVLLEKWDAPEER